MSDLKRGDVVSLSRAQTTRVTAAAGGPGTVHTVTLPINAPDTRDFSYEEAVGDGPLEVAAGLEEALLSSPGQSVYSVATGPGPGDLTIVGPLGVEFEVAVSALLAATLVSNAVSAVEQPSGRQIGLLRVVQAESTVDKLRSYASRSRDGAVQELEDVRLRELDSSNVFDVLRSDILTVVERSGEPRRQRIPATG